MIDRLLDALLDTLKLVPWLLVMHVLIEVFEYHAVSKIKLNKVLRGPLAPLVGGVCGILPQCGFGVVAADLYSRRSIRLGTMIAVFIATSDEAIPIMLSAPTTDALLKLAVLLGCKLAAALIAGYLLNLMLRRRELQAFDESVVLHGCHHHELGEHTHEEEHRHEHAHEHAHDDGDEREEHARAQEEHSVCGNGEKIAMRCTEDATEKNATDPDKIPSAVGTDTAAVPKKKFDFKCFVLHPLLHTLTVAGYILAVNVLFAVILHFTGEARLESFLSATKWYQPFLAGLVGLIPNCASSVILAQMFVRGSITLGAAFAGLSVNAGLGLAVLLRKNRPVRHTLLIAGGLYLFSCLVGMLLTLVPM